MKKILLLLLAFVFVGCTTETGKVEGETVKVVHEMGEAEVSIDIKKVAIFDLGILDIFNNLEIDVEYALPVASLPDYLDEYSEALNAGTFFEPNLELLFEFEPDVIFISGRTQPKYEDLNEIAPTIFVSVGSDTYLEDLEANVLMVAGLFDKVEAAETLVAEIGSLTDEVKDLSKDLADKALIVMYNKSLSVYGSGSRFGIIHDTLGIKEADPSIESSTHGQAVNPEFIRALNPDIIFVVDRTVVTEGSTGTDVFAGELYKNLIAVKNDKVFYLNAVAWYTVSGGISSTKLMLNEIKTALN